MLQRLHLVLAKQDPLLTNQHLSDREYRPALRAGPNDIPFMHPVYLQWIDFSDFHAGGARRSFTWGVGPAVPPDVRWMSSRPQTPLRAAQQPGIKQP